MSEVDLGAELADYGDDDPVDKSELPRIDDVDRDGLRSIGSLSELRDGGFCTVDPWEPEDGIPMNLFPPGASPYTLETLFEFRNRIWDQR